MCSYYAYLVSLYISYPLSTLKGKFRNHPLFGKINSIPYLYVRTSYNLHTHLHLKLFKGERMKSKTCIDLMFFHCKKRCDEFVA